MAVLTRWKGQRVWKLKSIKTIAGPVDMILRFNTESEKRSARWRSNTAQLQNKKNHVSLLDNKYYYCIIILLL